MFYYSAKENGFYADNIHGPRTLQIPDPAWKRPTKTIPNPDYKPGAASTPKTLTVPDADAIAPLKTIANADTKIPPDAVPISDEQRLALLDGQSAGKIITADATGKPILKNVPSPTVAERKAATKQAANTKAADAIAALTAGAPVAEIAARYRIEQEARAHQANANAPTPLLTAIAAARGKTTSEQAAEVIASADADAAALGYIIGKRQAFTDAAEKAKTNAALDAIAIDYSPAAPQ